jgi:hypothetical protein
VKPCPVCLSPLDLSHDLEACVRAWAASMKAARELYTPKKKEAR